ncbi:MAG TPA: (d)CMP kinase [Lachnospiraceae bacterium]|uniref:(d)CMP kinase n=1 Tax=Roseburia sp. AM59-24XD TaxID=2293138 RepID=UPI000E4F557F|nr:(d)CMP kinase [Roseburia sp. AM59-24XD]RHP84995.1 (d)CMP kinase [Roseburia sp. AM59-24XD]HCS15285.1 (d)CMP kinase [Lachnospiraceae bacterium]
MKSIAIDGPAGAGKSTIARKVAEKLSFIYVDTGAMYRSMALYFIRHDIAAQDEEKIAAACPDIDVSIAYQDGEQQVILNGENVNGLIRTEQVSMMTSDTSKYPVVREKLLSLQRGLAEKENVIMDGRDIGTCVLPNADVKIYLTASAAERARRRYKEQTERGVDCDIKEIERDIIARDEQDMNREVAPLRQAEDAVLVDSSDMTIDQVVDEIIRIYQEKTV